MVSVALRPATRVVPPGTLFAAEFAALEAWIALNRQVLIEYWTGDIAYTEDAMAALQPLPQAGA